MNIEHSLQKDLNAVQVWMNANKLKLNLAKTFAMLIGTRQRVRAQKVKLAVDDRLIEQVSTRGGRTLYAPIHKGSNLGAG